MQILSIAGKHAVQGKAVGHAGKSIIEHRNNDDEAWLSSELESTGVTCMTCS